MPDKLEMNLEENGHLSEGSKLSGRLSILAGTHGRASNENETVEVEKNRYRHLLNIIRTRNSDAVGPPPDRGLNAWSQVALCYLAVFNTWGYVNSFGIFQTHYTTTLELAPSTISWIGSLQIFLLFFLGTFSGRATDAGFFRPVFIIGTLFQLLGVFAQSGVTRYWQILLAQGICTGIGNGLVFCSSFAILSGYFLKSRALAIGIAAGGSATGGVIFPQITWRLLPKIGFPWTVRVLGFVMLSTACLTIPFFRSRLGPRRTGPFLELGAFKEMPYLLFSISMFFTFWGLYFAFYYVGIWTKQVLGADSTTTIGVLSAMNGLGLFGRLLPGYISDQYTGPLNGLLPFVGFSSICLYRWVAVKSIGGVYAFAVFYGFFAAGIQSLFLATLGSLTQDPKKTGVRMGMVLTVISVPALTGSPLGGALVSRGKGDYLYAQMFAGASMAMGFLFLLATRGASHQFAIGDVGLLDEQNTTKPHELSCLSNRLSVLSILPIMNFVPNMASFHPAIYDALSTLSPRASNHIFHQSNALPYSFPPHSRLFSTRALARPWLIQTKHSSRNPGRVHQQASKFHNSTRESQTISSRSFDMESSNALAEDDTGSSYHKKKRVYPKKKVQQPAKKKPEPKEVVDPTPRPISAWETLSRSTWFGLSHLQDHEAQNILKSIPSNIRDLVTPFLHKLPIAPGKNFLLQAQALGKREVFMLEFLQERAAGTGVHPMSNVSQLEILASCLDAGMELPEARKTYDLFQTHYHIWLSKTDMWDANKLTTEKLAKRAKLEEEVDKMDDEQARTQKFGQKGDLKRIMSETPTISKEAALQKLYLSKGQGYAFKKRRKLKQLQEDKMLMEDLGMKPTQRTARAVPEHRIAKIILQKGAQLLRHGSAENPLGLMGDLTV
ncbi:Aspyridones efflux protein apdF [Lachnellula suecica]|uniref:Aspyridones efflux protein apdF n=1 Tax=Lachnellula suecica TaxID=602035 RepID=A0A8T9CL42_9HELO|nr:Aspyridones efflux protein apdF [Lachnellula suecica]